jgi:uncharacterized protein
MEASEIKIKTFFISLAAIAGIEGTAKIAVSGSNLNPMMILGAVRLLEIILIIGIVLVWGKGISSMGLAPSTMIHGIKKGVLWSAVFGLVTFFAFWALFLFDINALKMIHTRLPEKNHEIILFFWVGGIVGPIAEEVFFRGMLYGFFRRWGILAALLPTTLIFVLAHPVCPGISATRIVGGLIFAVSYEMEASLMVPITIHILGNLAIFTLSLIG